jgi:hypothetical protein
MKKHVDTHFKKSAKLNKKKTIVKPKSEPKQKPKQNGGTENATDSQPKKNLFEFKVELDKYVKNALKKIETNSKQTN